MAIFQPNNIFPDTFTNSSVIDVNDNMEISWQVGGKSLLRGFRIDFYKNDFNSTYLTTTNYVEIPNGFYGTDRFGMPKFYTYDAKLTWKQMGTVDKEEKIKNGYSYKMRIFQYYIEDENEYRVTFKEAVNVKEDTNYYYEIPTTSENKLYVSFVLPSGKYPIGTAFYYNNVTKQGGYIRNGNVNEIPYTESTTQPTIGTNLGLSSNLIEVRQSSPAVFFTVAKPKLEIYRTDTDQYIWDNGAGDNLLNPKIVSIKTNAVLGIGSSYYFSFTKGENLLNYAQFTLSENILDNVVLYYDVQKNTGYYIDNGTQVSIGQVNLSTNPPQGIDIGQAYANVTTSIGYFHANYIQPQGKPIQWVRWRIAVVNNGVIGDILADTHNVYTSTLDYEYNGLFNGTQYAIRCNGMSESNQTCDTGWIFFNTDFINQGEYTGKFSVQCLRKSNAAYLSWEGVKVIPPTVNPQDYKPPIINGSVTLEPKNPETGDEYSVTWNKEYIYDNETKESEEIPMNFKEPWTAVWKGNANFKTNLKEKIKFGENTTINALVFSPNGSYLAVGVNSLNNYRIVVYKVEKDDLTLFQTISTITNVNLIEFAPNSTIFIANGGNSNSVNIYEIQHNNIVNKGSIKINDTDLQINNLYGGSCAKFSANGKFFVVAQSQYSYNVALFAVNDFDIIYLKELESNSGSITGANCAAFSMDSNLLLVERSTIRGSGGSVLIFEFNNNTYNYKSNLLNSATDKYYSLAFSPLGNILAVAGISSTRAYINYYEISGNELNFNHSTSIRTGAILGIDLNSLTFSHDGNSLMCITSSSGNGYSIHLFVMNGTQDIKLKEMQEKSYEKIIQFSPNSKYILTVNDIGDLPSNKQDNIAIYNYAQGNGVLLDIKLNEINSLQLEKKGVPLYIKYNNNILTAPMYVNEFDNVIAIIKPTQAVFNFYLNNELVEKKISNINYNQQSITFVSILGGNNGIKVDTVSIYNNAESSIDIAALYQNPNFEPVWNSDQYKIYMTANFTTNLEGGIGTATGTGFRIYRKEYGTDFLKPVATVPSTTIQMKDYGLRSRTVYEYYLYAYDSNGAFMNAVEGNEQVYADYDSYSLMVCDYDSNLDEYHVRKQYIFALNMSNSAVSNNNNPSINANFTKYPTRMPSSQNYASGTLSALIGVIYTKAALIKEVGNRKWVTKPSTIDYFDNIKLEQELYNLSTEPYQLFLRDMKGHLRMIVTSAPITQTTNINQRQQSNTISLQWVEIGDATNVTVIQTPDDYGWNNDNDILLSNFVTNTTTGELSVRYPYPYNGTIFSLAGGNKELLQAKTPTGVTPAKFVLENGKVSAIVKINKEPNEED